VPDPASRTVAAGEPLPIAGRTVLLLRVLRDQPH
jgi:hypothetical protein